MKRLSVKPRHSLPLITLYRRQRGASLIAAIFVIVGLTLLGALMTQLLVLGTEETIDEWYSAQALYAAESGVQWSIYNAGANTTNQTVVNSQAWFDVNVVATPFNGGAQMLYTITSTGKAGGSAANPRTQRRIVVEYMP